ncbi:MAG TPA: hypothetical protein VN861_02975 [Candidatus Acidoferrales bacterium]|nr:hypothetical protein [Candidatus Acidoferrales bacterium]
MSADTRYRCSLTGIVCPVDVVSRRAPLGARGHRVVVPGRVAGVIAHTLVGKPICVSGGGKGHWGDDRSNLGTVVQAQAIPDEGILIRGELDEWPIGVGNESEDGDGDGAGDEADTKWGLSFEITGVAVASMRSDDWVIEDGEFTGVAVVREDRAAFGGTWVRVEQLESAPTVPRFGVFGGGSEDSWRVGERDSLNGEFTVKVCQAEELSEAIATAKRLNQAMALETV